MPETILAARRPLPLAAGIDADLSETSRATLAAAGHGSDSTRQQPAIEAGSGRDSGVADAWPLGAGQEAPSRAVATSDGTSPLASARDAGQPSPRRRVLVVDDNHDAADTLAMMLELLGHEARPIYEPLTAVETVAQFQPQVVFLDIGMPVLDGYELARRLRAAPGGHDLVLVALTGWGRPEDRRRTRDAGFDHHLVKPPEIEAIRQACTRAPDRIAIP